MFSRYAYSGEQETHSKVVQTKTVSVIIGVQFVEGPRETLKSAYHSKAKFSKDLKYINKNEYIRKM